MKQTKKLLLASASPRRREILEAAGLDFEVAVSPYDEPPLSFAPSEIAKTHALAKVVYLLKEANPKWQNHIYVGVDTIVVIDDEVLYKPVDASDAARMLKMQSGREVTVMSGLAVIDPESGQEFVGVESTKVKLSAINDAEIAWYLSTGEWEGKSGGFAIQGLASRFFEYTDGDILNVVGLPLNRLYQILKSWQVFVP